MDLIAHLPKWGSTTGLYNSRGARGPKADPNGPSGPAARPPVGAKSDEVKTVVKITMWTRIFRG